MKVQHIIRQMWSLQNTAQPSRAAVPKAEIDARVQRDRGAPAITGQGPGSTLPALLHPCLLYSSTVTQQPAGRGDQSWLLPAQPGLPQGSGHTSLAQPSDTAWLQM